LFPGLSKHLSKNALVPIDIVRTPGVGDAKIREIIQETSVYSPIRVESAFRGDERWKKKIGSGSWIHPPMRCGTHREEITGSASGNFVDL
jgi:hypothetical protein